jgi:lipopolysaccharide biosynthesis protein
MVKLFRLFRESILFYWLEQALIHLHAWLAYGISFVDQADPVENVRQGRVALDQARRVAVFVHYDQHGSVHDFIYHYIRELAECGFAIIFVSNCPKLAQEDTERLVSVCALVVQRRNRGYDFGAYRDGIALIPSVESLEHLVLANDSVYGPLNHLGPMLDRMDASRAEVWGATDSWEHAFHLQSYFILFHSAALKSKAFAGFWKNVRLVDSKAWVIRKYEINLTRVLQRDNLRCRAVYAYREIVRGILKEVSEGDLLKNGKALPHEHRHYLRRIVSAMNAGVPMNSPHVFWDYLIKNLNFPFLKRELIVKNPMKVPNLVEWEGLIRTATEYDPDLIVRHLEISLRNRSI